MEIVLFTDFGSADIYVGQVKSVLKRIAPKVPVIDLANDLPPYNIRAAAHLLDALKNAIPKDSVFLCVVDPGVGTDRDAVIVASDERRYVGPDNGLLSVIAARAWRTSVWRIDWRPEPLSDSFHGRDLFAPVAAHLAAGTLAPDQASPISGLGVDFGADDLEEIIYIDHYGNACTGIRAAGISHGARLNANARVIGHARVFSNAAPGAAFWYENASGLVEIAANRASAASLLGLPLGQRVHWESAS